MKILVVGAGVLGSLYAARLAQVGQNVTILARGSRAVELRERGIVLQNAQTGLTTVTRVTVIETLDPDEAFDWVLVLVRNNQLDSVLPRLAASRATPNVIFMVNNAAGPQKMVDALGAGRTVLGFAGAGGTRKEGVVTYTLAGKLQATTLGELDGRMTPRLMALADALEQAGFAVAISPDMDAWLKTHAVLVTPVALAVYLAGGDHSRLSRTRDGLVLTVRAIREGLTALNRLGIPILPARARVIAWVPEPVIVALLRPSAASERFDLIAARHANAARDEMAVLAGEVQALIRRSGVSSPNFDWMCEYLNPSTPAMPDGQKDLHLHWRGLIAALAAGTAAYLLLRRLFRSR